MAREFARIGKDEVFGRLAQGRAASVSVLTPNRRLAQALQRDFDHDQQSRGLTAWETADILPFDAFVERLWESALYSERAATLPLLLTALQEQALWEESIRGSRLGGDLFSIASTASQCREAWRLQHAWRLVVDPSVAITDDCRAFTEWSSGYREATRGRGQTDVARLPDVVVPLLDDAAMQRPGSIVLHGFEILTPQFLAFVEALSARGCAISAIAPPTARSQAVRLSFTDAREEIDTAARWARSRLEANPRARIGIVVPDLARMRSFVERRFAAVMQPRSALPGEAKAMPYNLSLGRALDDFPPVHDALAILALAGPEIPFEDASRIVRSPFIAGGEAEIGARARLDAKLRDRCGATVTLDSLVRLCGAASAPRAPILVDRLERLARWRKSDLFGLQSAAEWARAFSEALRLVGFPGERTHDSTEHQSLEKWHDVLAQFATLEHIAGKMGFQDARERITRIVRDTTFQPEAADVPVQIVGVLEAAGQEFEHLWVTGLTDEQWPLPVRFNPFVPASLQRQARIPRADAAASLELDRRLTDGWLAAADEVVLSHFRMREDSELLPSPLITTIAETTPEAFPIPRYPTLREAIREAGSVVAIDDERGPAVVVAGSVGGTGLFRDQAACPFRAFATYRLASKPVETPAHGITPADRGKLVHEMLKVVWQKVTSRVELEALGSAGLDALLEESADKALAEVRRHRLDALEGRFADLERERLIRVVRAWLELEMGRDDFEVVAVEEKGLVTFGGLTVEVRLDRMDRLAAGGEAVIDYKTGACKVGEWLGPRPDSPQLPMYALGRAHDVAAVAFAEVKIAKPGFKGIGRGNDLIAGVTTVDKLGAKAKESGRYRDWRELVDGWRGELESLGKAFAAGEARVDPKRGIPTCKNCVQQMLCRSTERTLAEDDPDE